MKLNNYQYKDGLKILCVYQTPTTVDESAGRYTWVEGHSIDGLTPDGTNVVKFKAHCVYFNRHQCRRDEITSPYFATLPEAQEWADVLRLSGRSETLDVRLT